MLRERAPQARFVLVGTGPMRPALEALIAQYRLGRRVTLMGECHDMPTLYRSLDVLISSSYSEALPLAVMEAMACGLPVVATRVGGVPELVAHGSTGWLVEAGDFQGLASSAASLIEQPELRTRFSLAARERVVTRFDIGSHVNAYSALLARLAGAGAGTSPSKARLEDPGRRPMP